MKWFKIRHIYMVMVIAVALLLLCMYSPSQSELQVDPNGYVMFCPCMGRFGNKADHYLGAISFAAGLNRTLVLPPFIESQLKLVPYDTYFRMEPIETFHRVILMEKFMKELAPTVWPQQKRISFCSRFLPRGKPNDCNAKFFSHMQAFWGDVEFEYSIDYGYELHYFTRFHPNAAKKWKDRYPSDQYPVIAFSGAPAKFPVQAHDLELQKLFEWSDPIKEIAAQFIRENFPSTFLALHLRVGSDWKETCSKLAGKRHLMASPQCLGYHFEHGDEVTKDMCYPSTAQIINQVVSMIAKTKIKAVFVATDSKDFIDTFEQLLPIKVVKYRPSNPQVDLAILEEADYYIGNCVSSFAAFAVRARRLRGKPVDFWGFHPHPAKEEL